MEDRNKRAGIRRTGYERIGNRSTLSTAQGDREHENMRIGSKRSGSRRTRKSELETGEDRE